MHQKRNHVVSRSDMCGGDQADGTDHPGASIWPRCAGRLHGARDGEARGLATMLGTAVAAALREGLPLDLVRQVVEAEITSGGES